MRVSMEGGEPATVRQGVRFSRLSPDGERFLAWEGEEEPNARPQTVVFPASGGEPTRTYDAPTRTYDAPGDALTFTWSPDGQGVDFVASREGMTNVWRQPLAGGKARQVTAWK